MSRTLADMSPDERHQMIGRWCELPVSGTLVVFDGDSGGTITIMIPGETRAVGKWDIIPRLDLPPAWTPEGKPIPGEWEEGYICIDWDEPDMSDGRPHGPMEPVSIEGQATGEMCYFDDLPDGLSVTMSADGTGEGKARRFVTEWEAHGE